MDAALVIEELQFVLRHEPFELCEVDERWSTLVDEGVELLLQ